MNVGTVKEEGGPRAGPPETSDTDRRTSPPGFAKAIRHPCRRPFPGTPPCSVRIWQGTGSPCAVTRDPCLTLRTSSPQRAQWSRRGWPDRVDRVAGVVESFRPSALVVSLGVDAAISDPESPLLISERGFEDAGARLGALGLPAVMVQEGGYDLSTIADLVMAFVGSFEARREAGT